jgi:hypothetical protein
VALAEATPSWVGRREAELILGGLPYLSEVWRDDHWMLYAVQPVPSIVDGATLVAADRGGVTVDVPAPSEVLLRVRWSRWLRLSGPAGACLAPRGEWTVLRAARPGRYAVSGGLADRGPAC